MNSPNFAPVPSVSGLIANSIANARPGKAVLVGDRSSSYDTDVQIILPGGSRDSALEPSIHWDFEQWIDDVEDTGMEILGVLAEVELDDLRIGFDQLSRDDVDELRDELRLACPDALHAVTLRLRGPAPTQRVEVHIDGRPNPRHLLTGAVHCGCGSVLSSAGGEYLKSGRRLSRQENAAIIAASAGALSNVRP